MYIYMYVDIYTHIRKKKKNCVAYQKMLERTFTPGTEKPVRPEIVFLLAGAFC